MVGEETKQDRILHVLNRLAFGPRPGDFEHVSAIGPERYVQEQLHPETIAIPADLVARVGEYRTLHMSPIALFVEYQRPLMQERKQAKAEAGGDKADIKDATKDLRIKQRVVMREAFEARLMRAIDGPRQLQEVMTAFWFNHFNIFAGKGLDLIWTGSFEETAIRPHTFGKFRALLGATAHHPAMLFYLDNWQNTDPGSPGAKGKFEGINENYARELMELHTLGVNGGYHQADVIALAHILTGWGLPRPGAEGGGRRGPGREMAGGSFPFMRRRRNFLPPAIDPSGFYFDESRHDFSNKTFLGHQIEGGGINEGEHALDILARSPATANHLSFELAQYFVADDSATGAREPDGAALPRDRRRDSRGARDDVHQRGILGPALLRRQVQNAVRVRHFVRARDRRADSQLPAAVRHDADSRHAAVRVPDAQRLLEYAGRVAQSRRDDDAAQLCDRARLGLSAARESAVRGRRRRRGGGEMHREPPVVARNGGGKVNIKFDPGPHGPKMTPPDPVQLAATLGDYFSPATASAVEASPPQLRAPLILGSPEFMKR